MLLSDVCVTPVAYIGLKSRIERPRKTKIGTEVTHVTRDSDTTFKVKRSKVKVTGGGPAGAYCGGLPHTSSKLCGRPPQYAPPPATEARSGSLEPGRPRRAR